MKVKALEAANRALDLEFNDSWVLNWTADALTWIGELERTVGIMEHATGIDPDGILNQMNLGHALVHAGQIEKGISIIERALQQSPRDHYIGIANLFLSIGHNQLGDFKQAEKTARKAVQLLAGTPVIWLSYINALAMNDKKDEAQRGVKELLRISPDMTPKHMQWVYKISFSSNEGTENHLSGLRKLDWS